MVVVHVAAGALGMLVGLFLFRGYGLIWMLVLSVLAGNVAILMSGVVVAVRNHRSMRESARPESWKSASNAE
jgi:hypothetical protein